jgi:hypothetical protein
MKNILFVSLTALMPLCGFAAGAVTKGLSKLLPRVEYPYCPSWETPVRLILLPKVEVLFRPGCEMPVQIADRAYERPHGHGVMICLIADRHMGELSHMNLAERVVSRVDKLDYSPMHGVEYLQKLQSVYEEVAPTDWLVLGKNRFDLGIMLARRSSGRFMLCTQNKREFGADSYHFPAIIEGKREDKGSVVLKELVEIPGNPDVNHLRILYDRGEVEKIRRLVIEGLMKRHRDFAILLHPGCVRQRVDDGQ